MRIRRLHNPVGWTTVPNALIEDRSISWRARGILVYLLSRPDGWDTDSERLAEQAGLPGEDRQSAAEGRDAVRRALNELDDANYLHRVKRQTQRGDGERRVGTWVTDVYVSDHPTPDGIPGLYAPENAENPHGENPVDNSGEEWAPTPEKPNVGKPGLLTNTKNQLNTASTGDLPSNSIAPVENGAGYAGPALPELAALADAEPAQPALSSTDSIALVSRLEPGIQMFALRAHLRQSLGYQLDFDAIGALVVDAHHAAPPSHRGRLRDRDVVEWVAEFVSSLEHDSGSASVEGPGSAGNPTRGHAPAEPA